MGFAKLCLCPCLQIDPHNQDDLAIQGEVFAWLGGGGLQSSCPVPPPTPVLNVARARESAACGIHDRVRRIMCLILDPCARGPWGGE